MRLLVALAISLLTLVAVGCGATTKRSGGSSTSTAARAGASAGDAASESAEHIATYGHEAEGVERREITALVERYYAAAAADDGSRACSMLYSIIEEVVAEDYGQPPGPPELRGKTCAVVMSKIFKRVPRQPSAVLAHTKVTGIRVKGRRGFVQLTSAAMPTGDIPIQREHSAWRIDSLIGQACTDCAPSASAVAAGKRAGAGTTPSTSSGAGTEGETPGSASGDAISPSSAPVFTGPRHRDADDGDEDPRTYDDDVILDYGRSADPADRLAITELARRYYRAAAAGDGAAGCSLLYSLVAESMPEEPNLSSGQGPVTCASILSSMFRRSHRRLAADAAAFKVVGVRVDGKRAYVLLSFVHSRVRYTIVHRDGGPWKVEQLFDTRLP